MRHNVDHEKGETLQNKINSICNDELIRLRKAYQITTGTQRLLLTRVANLYDLSIHVSDENF